MPYPLRLAFTLYNRRGDCVTIILGVQEVSMGNVADVIPFEGECGFHPILHHVTLSRDSVVVRPYPTSNSDRTINHVIHLIYCNHARLDLRIQQLQDNFWKLKAY